MTGDVQIAIRAFTGDENSIGLTRAFKEATFAVQELANALGPNPALVCCGEGTSLFEIIAPDGVRSDWVRLCNVCRERVD